MRFAWRHVPHAIFFVTCACMMVLELVAGRLIARHLGSSLYTWTAVIGVILAGATAGNVLGGRLADRRRPEATLPWLLLATALASASALGLNALFAATRPLRGLDWPLQILLSVVAIFILPATALGTISPTLAKVAVSRGRRVGSALGSFYACGTIGSIAGTFLTGFWLIFALGNARVVALAAGALAALGIVAFAGRSRTDGPNVVPDGAARTSSDARTLARTDEAFKARYTPHAIVFFAAACLMIVEMLASRIIAEQAGSSLYTWTSVIGVVFAGMSIGNYLGGWLSDRFEPVRLMAWLFLAASIAVTAVLVLSFVSSTREPFAAWHWPAMVFATVFSIFFLPSVLLGTFVPAATKMAVQQATAIGRSIGSVSAWNAAGSIVGTIAVGFWLIPALGTRSLVMAVACVLAMTAVVLARRRSIPIAWAVAAIALFVVTRTGVEGLAHIFARPALHRLIGTNASSAILWKYQQVFREGYGDEFSADSAYQYIRVYEDTSEDEPDRTLRVLSLDHLIHGYVDMADPSYLNYGYERIYADVARRYVGDRMTVSAFFIGGGSYTFPRWLLAEWPGSKAVVAEIDPMVPEANYRATGLRRDTPIRTIVMDARNAVDDLPPDARFDFFFGDAFNDLAVPYHLTTLEFSRKVASHLTPNGAYLVNLIDNYQSGLLLGSFVGALERAFRHVYVFCTERGGVTARRDTFVVAASNVPLDVSDWQPNHGTDFEGSVLTEANIAELRRKCRGRILTDDDAPVENLIAPVVRERTGQDQ